MSTLPVLPVEDVSKAVKFYTETLGFTELFQVPGPDGKVQAGQVEREGCNIMFNLNPWDSGKEGGGIYLWVRVERANLDSLFQELKKRGVHVVDDIKDQFWGDRSFTVKDLNGYTLAFNQKIRKS
jgi:PhnB protein